MVTFSSRSSGSSVSNTSQCLSGSTTYGRCSSRLYACLFSVSEVFCKGCCLYLARKAFVWRKHLRRALKTDREGRAARAQTGSGTTDKSIWSREAIGRRNRFVQRAPITFAVARVCVWRKQKGVRFGRKYRSRAFQGGLDLVQWVMTPQWGQSDAINTHIFGDQPVCKYYRNHCISRF